MATEIERKYLVRHVPDNLTAYPHTRILQGYIAADPNGNEVRLRQRGEAYFITVKNGDSLVRAEYEVELSQAQFEVLWPSVASSYLVKTRYELPAGDYVLELDVYEGPLRGLRTVEVEFADEETCQSFVAPDWFGDEISEDPQFRNRRLAEKGLPDDMEVQ